MNQLQTFNYAEIGEVRVVTRENEPWVVLKDVCNVLGLGSPNKVAARLDEDEKGRNLIPSLGGDQQMTVINESGLYNVILRSDKPEAKRFKRWVTHEVLPAIRRQGGYMPDITSVIAQTVRATLEVVKPALELEESEKKRTRYRNPPTSVELLDVGLREEIEELILSNKMTYAGIVEHLNDVYGIRISRSAIGRHALKLYKQR
jgi:prophage antirepressor-like protein